jgi:hypothetical protein
MFGRNDDNHRHNTKDDSSSTSWAPVAVVSAVAAATAVVVVGTFLYQTVPEYGWEGTLRYLWEGDAYSPELRRLVDTLETAEIARSLQESRIHAMEAALDLARLNSVDVDDDHQQASSSSREIVRAWVDCFAAAESGQSLERTLADVSHQLDKIAAKIDGVVLSSSSGITKSRSSNHSELIDRIKKRKKLLSKSIVTDMERCDVLMGSYQVLQE